MPVERYRKRPLTIEALKFEGDNVAEVAGFLGWDDDEDYAGVHDAMHIETLEGDMEVSTGDYVIKGVAGEFYPCKPDVFAQTYEPAFGCRSDD